MKLINFVILFLSLSFYAHSKTPAWPKATTQNVQGKTFLQIFKEVCKGKAVCKKPSKETLADPAKFKIQQQNETTLMVSYKKDMATISHETGTTIYKINKKSVDLSQVKEQSELMDKIGELLPNNQAGRFSIWLNYANALETKVAGVELQLAMTLLVAAQHESEVCQQAQKVADKCDEFGKTAAVQIYKNVNHPANDLSTPIIKLAENEKKVYSAMQTVSSMADTLQSLYNPIPPQKKEAIERCECIDQVCKVADKPSETGRRLKSCVETLQAIKKQYPENQAMLDRIKILDEAINAFTIKPILPLPIPVTNEPAHR